MRVLQSGIYNNFLQDQASAKTQIDKLTTQISSGKKIDNSYEDSSVYVDTLRLNSEISALQGVQNRTEKSKVITDASDSAMNDMDLTLIDFKSKLILAANGTMNQENLESVATELQLQKEHLMNLANSSINGQYIFSGSATNVKPIDSNGDYHGNNQSLKTLISEKTEAPYSIDGESLFHGINNAVHKSVSTNVHLQNQTTNETLTTGDTVGDLLNAPATFKLSGVKHSGEAFKSDIALSSSDTISTLLSQIETAYGTGSVKAELSDDGTIMINDLKKGNSKLDFQMTATNGTDSIAFTNNNLVKADASIDDSAYFAKEDNVLTGNIPLLSGDGFATAGTKLSDIAGASMDNKLFSMDITDVNGSDKTITLDLSATSSFSVDGNTYSIYDADDTAGATQTAANNFTIGQLSNVVSMVMSGNLPVGSGKDNYDTAVTLAKDTVDVGINKSGELEIEDKSAGNADIKFSFYDSDANGASLSLMGNKAVVVADPKINFFKDLDTIIEAVRDGMLGIDSTGSNPQNPGLQNAISKIDTLTSHFSKAHTAIGAMSNNLQAANERSSTLELNVTALKSQVADVDIAEAVIKYQQVSLNYQAMMSTISKVNSLTLLNYLN